MKTKGQSAAFTLIEVLIVVVIMVVLAATIVPRFTDGTNDAKASSVRFNLQMLRSQIQLYRSQHGDLAPSGKLVELLASTDGSGNRGLGADFPYGPYLRQIPVNPYSNSAAIKAITNHPAQATDVTGTGGWLYNATTGGIFIDNATHFTN